GVSYDTSELKSHCTTITHSGTCKIDVCGRADSRLYQKTVGCKTYLRNLLHDCKSGSVVGGQIFPQQCNVHYDTVPVIDPDYKDGNRYRIQFSHH
ncbi:hypothetical protein C8Q80DRAFT_1110250, partial [Daedaleopsis nitida]